MTKPGYSGTAIGECTPSLFSRATRFILIRNELSLRVKLVGVPAGIDLLLVGLVLDADEGGGRGEFAAVGFFRFDIADQMRRARHRRQHQRACFKQPLHPDRENGVILINDGCDIERIGLARLARHPIDSLRLVELEPLLELSGVEQPCLLEQEQLDPALHLVVQHHAASAVR